MRKSLSDNEDTILELTIEYTLELLPKPIHTDTLVPLLVCIIIIM